MLPSLIKAMGIFLFLAFGFSRISWSPTILGYTDVFSFVKKKASR